MVIFRQYISPSTKLKYLVVETEDGGERTRFSTQTSLAGRYASLWLSLKNPLHMASWTSVKIHKSNKLLKLWSLQAPDHYHGNIATFFPSLGRRIIQGVIRWGNTMIVEGEYRHISGYWEWTEDVLGIKNANPGKMVRHDDYLEKIADAQEKRIYEREQMAEVKEMENLFKQLVYARKEFDELDIRETKSLLKLFAGKRAKLEERLKQLNENVEDDINTNDNNDGDEKDGQP